MYQGATGSAPQGKGRKGNARRRRRTKKKNPATVTWILIAGASAAAVGGGIAYAVYRKKKKRALLPGNGGTTPTGNGRGKGGGGRGTGGTGTGQKVNAPKFPYTTEEAKQIEHAWAVAAVSESCATGECTSSVNEMSDVAFYEIYKIRQIPGPGTGKKRGSGWQPYIDSWLRIRDIVESLVEAATS